MFEAAELGHKVRKEDYDREVPLVREALLRLQTELTEANFPVIVVIGGVAAKVHVSDRPTLDVDVVYARGPDNLEAVIRAINPA